MHSLPTHTDDGQDATVSAQPPWLPAGVKFDSLPEPVQQSVLAILNPIYQMQVLEANDALEQGQGLSYCHLLFFEILMTYAVLERATEVDWSRLPTSKGLAALVGVTGQKNKIANFLFVLRKSRNQVERNSLADVERRIAKLQSALCRDKVGPAESASPLAVRSEPIGSLEKHGSC
jgi:hypothetical protein